MNATHLVSAGAVLLMTTACGYSIKTATDYNHQVNFSNYHSFFVIKGNPSGNSLMDERAQADVESALMSKGWIEVPQGQGEAVVVVHASTKTKHTYETLYDGWGGWGWRGGWRRGYGSGFGGGLNSSTTYVNNFKVGTLVVDIFDAQTKQVVWHGTATDALSDKAASNAEATQRAIDKMFTTFPPPAAVASGR
jgi:hypothetical protein